MKADMHIHSCYSDGSDTLPELLSNIQRAGIHTFSLTDHDTIDGACLLSEMIPDSLTYYRGIEFSAITRYREVHILGYDYDPNNKQLLATIEEGEKLRKNKLEHRLAYLKQQFGIVFRKEDVDYLKHLRVVAKPHLSRMLMKYGYASSITEGIEKYINGCPNDHDRIDYRQAIDAIHAAHGIAMWAHPLGGEHVRHFEQWELERQLKLLLDAGIDGLECYYSRYTKEEIQLLLSEAHAHQLLISGGSDYHGKNKNIALGTLSSEHLNVEEDQLTLLKVLENRKNKDK